MAMMPMVAVAMAGLVPRAGVVVSVRIRLLVVRRLVSVDRVGVGLAVAAVVVISRSSVGVGRGAVAVMRSAAIALCAGARDVVAQRSAGRGAEQGSAWAAPMVRR